VAAALTLLSVTGALAVAAYEKLAWALDPDIGVEKQVCGRCHSADRPRQYGRSPAAWRETVARMISRREAGAVSPRDARRVEALLIRRRSADPKWLPFLRCRGCHALSRIEPYGELSAEALRLLVKRHVVEKNNAIFAWEGDLIAEELVERFARRPPTPHVTSEASQILFESRCDVCHTISFRYRTMFAERKDDAQWRTAVERMREKAPELIPPGDVPALTDHIEKMRDTGRIAR
jgi:hypothetical protein